VAPTVCGARQPAQRHAERAWMLLTAVQSQPEQGGKAARCHSVPQTGP
jgi:hypothetical protein